jgi:hypothetical protein
MARYDSGYGPVEGTELPCCIHCWGNEWLGSLSRSQLYGVSQIVSDCTLRNGPLVPFPNNMETPAAQISKVNTPVYPSIHSKHCERGHECPPPPKTNCHL